jgi:hypothetical protein
MAFIYLLIAVVAQQQYNSGNKPTLHEPFSLCNGETVRFILLLYVFLLYLTTLWALQIICRPVVGWCSIMNLKGVCEESSWIRDAVPTFAGRSSGKFLDTSVRIVSVSAEIRTGHFSKKKSETLPLWPTFPLRGSNSWGKGRRYVLDRGQGELNIRHELCGEQENILPLPGIEARSHGPPPVA